MDGSLIINKPAGMTSHDVVARVRRAARTRRVGHAGTLDPFATGVLVVCIERATRLVQFLVGLDKEYLATVRLGFATDTQDVTGKQTTPLLSSNRMSLEDVRQVLAEFIGSQLQMPPMYSAKKVRGERLHRAARAGREVERTPVSINIYSIDLDEAGGPHLSLNEDGTRDFTIRVRCSSGTYIRTLAHDIGRRLGLGAHLASLCRTAVGGLTISNAFDLSKMEQLAQEGKLVSVLVSPAQTIGHLPAVHLDERMVNKVTNGRAIELSEIREDMVLDGRQPIRLCDSVGTLVAVGEFDPDRSVVKPRVVIRQ